jgi:uncharacterized delta-60 repeat protein
VTRKATGFLLGLLVVAACSATDQTADSRKKQREPTASGVKTAPAAGLWSHRFVRWRDGAVTAVGFSRKPAGIGLARYLPTGEVDRSFRQVVHPEFGAGKLNALAAVRSGADKLFIAGCQPPDCWGYFVLGRFRRDGSLDPGFGDHGLVRTSFPGGALEPRALALQRDGKIVVAGELSIDASRHGFLARYLPDGRADVGFGRKGLVLTDVDAITAVAVQSNGRIVAAGHRLNRATRPASSNVEVARYFADGQVDAGFGTGGLARAPALQYAKTLLIAPREKIVLAGSARRGYRPFVAIARLTASGELDRAFGRSGHVLHRRPGDHGSGLEAVTPLRDGSLLAAGWATRGRAVLTRRYRLVVLALRPSGKLVRRWMLGGVEARGQALFRTSRRRVLAVGADDDLEPKRIVFARIRLP